MVAPEMEALIREAWKAVAAEMGEAFLNVSWLCTPSKATALPIVDEDDSLPLAA